MRTRTALVAAALAAALVMGLAAGSASANKLSFSNRNFRITWATILFFTEGGNINPRASCPVTLEGSFHSATIRKVPGELIGYITRAIVNGVMPPCTEGTSAFLPASLPWHVTYEGFSGTLPRISEIEIAIHDVAVEIREPVFRLACLYRDVEEAMEPLRGEFAVEAGGRITTFTPNRRIRLRLDMGAGCPPSQFFEETPGTVVLLGTTNRIGVTLI